MCVCVCVLGPGGDALPRLEAVKVTATFPRICGFRDRAQMSAATRKRPVPTEASPDRGCREKKARLLDGSSKGDRVVELLCSILNRQEREGVPLSILGSLLVREGHPSWRVGFAPKHGPLPKFLSSHKDVFRFGPDAAPNRVSLVDYTGSGLVSSTPRDSKRDPALFGARERGLPCSAATVRTHRRTHRERNRFTFGNYDRYYNYRNASERWADARLPRLRPEWFAKRRCLDIGCNTGVLTVQMATRLGCSAVLGIDIDDKLIARANANRDSKQMDVEISKKFRQNEIGFPGEAAGGGSSKAASSHEGTQSVRAAYGLSEDRTASNKSPSSPPKNAKKINDAERVAFIQGNVLDVNLDEAAPLGQRPPYDTVCCFSVTKWIHFNWKDDGVKNLFSRVVSWLAPRGIFVLEPQPWKSYR